MLDSADGSGPYKLYWMMQRIVMSDCEFRTHFICNQQNVFLMISDSPNPCKACHSCREKTGCLDRKLIVT